MIKIKNDEISRACIKLGRNGRWGLQSGNLMEGDNLENIDVDERIGCGLDSGGTG
jgi:hypothetical protein